MNGSTTMDIVINFIHSLNFIPVNFVTGNAIVAHLIGDFCIQSNWMAMKKTSSSFAAFVHAITYSIPFFFFFPPPSLNAWLFIVGTHFLIDRFALIRYIIFVKHFLGPRRTWLKWEDCSDTGYSKDMPAQLSKVLAIVSDNTLHLLCNATALWIFP